MTEGVAQAMNPAVAEAALRQDLARGDAVLESALPILRHLLTNDEHSIFADDVIAAMRGMLWDLADQLAGAVDRATPSANRAGQAAELSPVLAARLTAQSELLGHVHALAIEAQLAMRLEARLALDPVLSPLLHALIGSNKPEVSSAAMAVLAAQARFVQSQRRMQLPLSELPADLLHLCLVALRQLCLETSGNEAFYSTAEADIRAAYDEGRSRLGLVSRLVSGLGGGLTAALSLSNAGVAIFLTALAAASGQERDGVVLATNITQSARLALTLRAAGVKSAAIAEQLEALHPDIALRTYHELLGPEQAAALLAQSLPGAKA